MYTRFRYMCIKYTPYRALYTCIFAGTNLKCNIFSQRGQLNKTGLNIPRT